MAHKYGPETGINTICLPEGVGGDEGSEASMTVTGKIIEHGGMKYLVADQVDGKDVQDVEHEREPEGTAQMPELPAESGEEPSNGGEALDQFMKEKSDYES